MSTDNIKDALLKVFPTTSAKDWKRRSKASVAGGQERTFENAVSNQTVVTLEAPDGTLTVDGITLKAPASVAAVTAPVASPAATKAAPAPKAQKPAPVASGTKVERNSMVPGSKWVFHKAVDIKLWVPKLGRERSNDAADYEQTVVQHLPVGTKFSVIAKFTASGAVACVANTDKTITDGWMARVVFDDPSIIHDGARYSFQRSLNKQLGLETFGIHPEWSGTEIVYKINGHELPFAQIADAITAESIPETLIYVLRDTATGELFGGWKDEKYTENWSNGDGTFRTYNGKRSDVGNAKMVTKLSSAKKYATSSACKASIREFTGYNTGLEEGADGGAYYIMGGKKAMDLPATWEMVEFDKVTGTEKRVIDVQNWLVSLNRLRVLTTTHGSAARAAYKKAEASKDDYPVIIVFQNRSIGSLKDYEGKIVNWDEKARFEDYRDGHRARVAIEQAAKKITGKKLKADSPSAVAFACQSLSDALFAKMAFDYEGRDHNAVAVTLLDFNTLEEIVETQA